MPLSTFSLFTSGPVINDNTTVSDVLNLGLGIWVRIVDLQIGLRSLSHTSPDDLDFLLVAPGGTNFEFWSDAGGSADITNGDFTIADSGASLLPNDTGMASGTYRPTNYGFESGSNWGLPGLIINSPAPADTATLSVFGGLWLSGNWTLDIRDDLGGGDVGNLSSWGIQGISAVIVKPEDFNRNQLSDILWQHSDGTPAIWPMNGTNATSVGGAGP